MSILRARARMTVTGTPGTGAVTLNAAVSKFQTFAAAGAANGELVDYLIEDGSAWEIGRAVYTSAGTSLARASTTDPHARFQSSSGSTLSLSSSAIVSWVALPSSLQPMRHAANLTTGKYVQCDGVTTITTTALAATANNLVMSPVTVDGVFDALVFEVTTLSAGNCRMGIYNCDKNGAPYQLIEEVASPPSTGSTGIKVALLAAARRINEPIYIATLLNSTPFVRRANVVVENVGRLFGGSTLSGTSTVYRTLSFTTGYAPLPSIAPPRALITQNATTTPPIYALRTA